MRAILSAEGYAQTKRKLKRMEERLTQLDQRTDISNEHRTESRQSYLEMIGKYRREIKLYEASHSNNTISR